MSSAGAFGEAGAHALHAAALPTGFAALDRYLPGGGWPLGRAHRSVRRPLRHRRAHVVDARSRGADRERTICGVNARKWVAWIAPPFVPYAPALQQRGVARRCFVDRSPDARKECLWTVEQVIRSGSSSAECWLGSRPPITSLCGVCSWRPKIRGVGRCCSGRSPLVVSGHLRLCVSVSSKTARSLEYESTNVAAHGPASSISPNRCAREPGSRRAR